MSTLPAPAENLQQQATATYKVLLSAFTNKNINDFWKLGNAVGTIIDYCRKNRESWPDASRKIQGKFNWFREQNKFKGLWFDDYLWWTAAALQTSLMGMLESGWIEIFKLCWTEAAPGMKVWDQWKNDPLLKHFEPRFPGGIWNGNWSKEGPWKQPSKKDPLYGIQNSVTNVLHLISAAAADYYFPNQGYQKVAQDEYSFLRQWFDVAGANGLLDQYECSPDHCALLRERVSSFADGTLDPYYRPNFYWTGDQGLLLKGMFVFMIMRGVSEKDKDDCLRIAQQVIYGVKNKLVVDQDLKRWTPGLQPPGDDEPDYEAGPGVFLRHLLYAYNATVLPILRQDITRAGFPAVIKAMANKVPDPPDPNGIVNDDLNPMTNHLATLVAAIDMPA